MIEVQNLSHSFGSRKSLDNVSLLVPAGSIVSLLGANGAGKSTLMRILCGLETFRHGLVRLSGFKLPNKRKNAHSHVGYVSQQFGLYDDLTVEENLTFYGRAYGLAKSTVESRVSESLDRFQLDARRRDRTGSLSHGWRQRVAMAAALTHRPEILLLDEATAGLDPVARRHTWRIIEEEAARGAAVLCSTHHFDEAGRANAVLWLHEGRVAGSGNYHDLAASRETFFESARIA